MILKEGIEDLFLLRKLCDNSLENDDLIRK